MTSPNPVLTTIIFVFALQAIVLSVLLKIISQSAMTVAQIQDYGFGTIVGEETGDYPSLYASVFNYQLPNTVVSVQVAKGRMVRVSGSTAEQGVIPDIFIRDHLLDEQDEILEGLLKQMETQ